MRSASKTELMARCGFWQGPHAVYAEDVGHPAQSDGTQFHGLACAIAGGEEYTGEVSERATLMALGVAPLLFALRDEHPAGSQTWPEVAMAWDHVTDTTTILHVGRQGRDYGEAAAGFCGTADLVVVTPSRVIVYDYKTARPGHDPADATAQLRACALMAARAYGKSDASYAAVVVNDNGVWPDELTHLDAFDLDTIASELRALLTADYTDAKPTPGPHCSERYCPARTTCPVTTGAVVGAIATQSRAVTLAPEFRFSTTIQSAEHAAWMIAALDLIEDGRKAARRSLEQYADTHSGVTLADGSVWAGVPVTTAHPDLSQPEALAIVPTEALEWSTTWSAIERAVGKPKAAEVRKALKAMGAVKISMFTKYEAKKPKAIKAKKAAAA